MTATEDQATVPRHLANRPDWQTGAQMRAQMLARAAAWLQGTDTGRTVLALALNADANLFDRVEQGRILTVDLYDRCMSGMDDLERLDAAAGPFTRPTRSGRSEAAYAGKEALRARVEGLAAALFVRPSVLALAVTHNSTLLHAGGGLSDAEFAAYDARLTAIEAALLSPQPQTGDADGEAHAEACSPPGHRNEGAAVHSAD